MNHAAHVAAQAAETQTEMQAEAAEVTAEAPSSLVGQSEVLAMTFEDIEREALAAAKGSGILKLEIVIDEEGAAVPFDVEVKRDSKHAGAFSMAMRFFLDEQRLPARAALLLVEAYEVRRR